MPGHKLKFWVSKHIHEGAVDGKIHDGGNVP